MPDGDARPAHLTLRLEWACVVGLGMLLVGWGLAKVVGGPGFRETSAALARVTLWRGFVRTGHSTSEQVMPKA